MKKLKHRITQTNDNKNEKRDAQKILMLPCKKKKYQLRRSSGAVTQVGNLINVVDLLYYLLINNNHQQC